MLVVFMVLIRILDARALTPVTPSPLSAPVMGASSFPHRFMCMTRAVRALVKGEPLPPDTDMDDLDLPRYTGGVGGAYLSTQAIAKSLLKSKTDPSMMEHAKNITLKNLPETAVKIAKGVAKKSALGIAAVAVGVPVGAAVGMAVAEAGLQVGSSMHGYITPGSSETKSAFMGAGLATGTALGFVRGREQALKWMPFLARLPQPYRTSATLLVAGMLGAGAKVVVADVTYELYTLIREKGTEAAVNHLSGKEVVVKAPNRALSRGVIRKVTFLEDGSIEVELENGLQPVRYVYDTTRGLLKSVGGTGQFQGFAPVANSNNPFLHYYLQASLGKQIPLYLPLRGSGHVGLKSIAMVQVQWVQPDVTGYLPSSVTVRRPNGVVETFDIDEISIPNVDSPPPTNPFRLQGRL